MKGAVMSSSTSIDRPGRLALKTASIGLRRLRRLIRILARAIRFDGENDIVRRYEGHSWCDSTERSMNNEIMSGRHARR